MMGPLFLHQNTKLWMWGGRSRLALPENIGTSFLSAVHVRRIPSKHATSRNPYKIRLRVKWGPEGSMGRGRRVLGTQGPGEKPDSLDSPKASFIWVS